MASTHAEEAAGAPAAIAISAVATFFAWFFTFVMYYQYRKHWTQPTTQTYVMVVCSLIPVWSLLGLLINILPEARYIMKVLLDLYEGFVIIMFMRLIYWYLGGKDQSHWKAGHKEPYRCCLIGCTLHPGGKTMRFLHLCIYQFAVTRPTFSFIICVLNYTGYWERRTPIYMAVTIMMFSMLFVAMWGLFQVYRIFSLVLRPYNVGKKFLAIKLYIFLHALQGFVFAFAEDFSSKRMGNEIELVHIEYTLFCCEMLLGGIINTYVFFSVKEYIEPEYEQNVLEGRSGVRTSSSYTSQNGGSSSYLPVDEGKEPIVQA